MGRSVLSHDGAVNRQFVRSNPCGEPAGQQKPSEPLRFERKRLVEKRSRQRGLPLCLPALDVRHRRDYLTGMSPPSDQPPSSSPSPKPKLSAEEQRARRDDRVMAIRLRMAIGQELDARGITTSAEIGDALGMPAADAHGLLTRRQWREGDIRRLQAAAARLGLPV